MPLSPHPPGTRISHTGQNPCHASPQHAGTKIGRFLQAARATRIPNAKPAAQMARAVQQRIYKTLIWSQSGPPSTVFQAPSHSSSARAARRRGIQAPTQPRKKNKQTPLYLALCFAVDFGRPATTSKVSCPAMSRNLHGTPSFSNAFALGGMHSAASFRSDTSGLE